MSLLLSRRLYYFRSISIDQICYAVVLGILPLIWLPRLPTTIEWLILIVIIIGLWICKCELFYFFIVLGLAFIWGTYTASTIIHMTNLYTFKQLEMVGSIQTSYLGQDTANFVVFKVDTVQGKSIKPFLVRLSRWKYKDPLLSGQRWRLFVTLLPVHGRLNQGGFNWQRWSVTHRQMLIGRVQQAYLLNSQYHLRQKILLYVVDTMIGLPNKDILVALIFGERGLLSKQKRELLQATTIAHLIAISGLHITFIAFLGWSIIRIGQFLLPRRWIKPILPLLFGIFSAGGYVWLAGDNPPALRAIGSLMAVLYLKHHGQCYSPKQILIRVIAVLLIIDPLMILSDSFWLSILAVSALLFWFKWVKLPLLIRQKKSLFFLRWLHLECGLLILLLPWQIMFFKGVNFWGVIANLWAVPIVSLAILPILFLALICAPINWIVIFLWKLADFLIGLVFWPLPYLAQQWFWVAPEWFWLGLLFWLLIPCLQCFSGYICSIICIFYCSLIYLPNWARTEKTVWQMTMLDVGHGLAIVFEHRSKALLYDTGDIWATGSMAEQVILPYLYWRGLDLEVIIISHDDKDHAGGIKVIQQAYPQVKLFSSSKKIGGQPCISGHSYVWQLLTFSFLWPNQQVNKAKNRDSCVIRVDDGRHRILLTGDLEKSQELALLDHSINLQADILQVAHHGSKSSSDARFIRQVMPKAALVSISRYNRWKLPHHEVIERFKSLNTAWYSTAQLGQINIFFSEDSWEIASFRANLSPRWYNQEFGTLLDNR